MKCGMEVRLEVHQSGNDPRDEVVGATLVQLCHNTATCSQVH